MSERRVNPIIWFIVAGVIVAAGFVGLIVSSVKGSMAQSCEVCMTFRGRTVCREAVGPTPQEATRTATDNACALLGATGMTLSIECSNTRPASVTCEVSSR